MKETARIIFRLERKIVKLSPGRICLDSQDWVQMIRAPEANTRAFGQEVLTHNIRHGAQLSVWRALPFISLTRNNDWVSDDLTNPKEVTNHKFYLKTSVRFEIHWLEHSFCWNCPGGNCVGEIFRCRLGKWVGDSLWIQFGVLGTYLLNLSWCTQQADIK